MAQFRQEMADGIYGGNMSNGYAASVMRDNMSNQAGMYCTPRDPQADEMTRQMLRDEVARHRAKLGMPALPEQVPAADSGQRNRKADKVSAPVNVGKHYSFTYRGFKIDPYRIFAIYGITEGPQQHAIKKLLRAGKSVKDLEQDVTEVISSLNRWLEMMREDAA